MSNSRDIKKIINGKLRLLEEKLTWLGVYASIIDKYFEHFTKNKDTRAFSLVINEFVKHLIGQLTSLLFDNSKKYCVVSLSQLNSDIEKHKEHADILKKHVIVTDNYEKNRICMIIDRYLLVNSEILPIKESYYEMLKNFRDKHYAHTEHIDQINQETQQLKITWDELSKLIRYAQDLTTSLQLFWSDTQSDFAQNQYDELQREFWNLIKQD